MNEFELQHLPEAYRPLSPWSYFGLGILYSLPLVGWIFLIVHAIGSTNLNRRNYARSYFCVYVLAIILIGIVTACLCGLALAFYIGVYVAPNANIDVSSYSKDLAKTTIIYAKDPDTGEYEEYETLEGDVNRLWVDLEEIPEDLRNHAFHVHRRSCPGEDLLVFHFPVFQNPDHVFPSTIPASPSTTFWIRADLNLYAV